MNIAIVTTEPYPVGMAATNRIRTYVKGFAEASHSVRVYVVRPTEQPGHVFNQAARGECDGGSFFYTCVSPVRARSPLTRLARAVWGLEHAALRLVFVERPDAIILVSNRTDAIVQFRLASWLAGAVYVQEKSEFPVAVRRGDNSAKARFYLKRIYRLFDGIICMTKPLEEYFAGVMRRGAKRIVVPMTVDAGRFASATPHAPGYPYLAYCGFLGGDKDGVPILIEAFSRIAGDYPDLRLLLIGDAGSKAETDALHALTERLGVADRVVFTGRVSRDEMPSLLAGARALCLARPDNKQAQGGFPTKLGEYLATGNPVVVTAVGAIPDYLTDGEHAILTAPDSAAAFANGLRRVLDDVALSARLGAAGRERAMEYFHYAGQTGRIIEFLQELRGKR